MGAWWLAFRIEIGRLRLLPLLARLGAEDLEGLKNLPHRKLGAVRAPEKAVRGSEEAEFLHHCPCAQIPNFHRSVFGSRSNQG